MFDDARMLIRRNRDLLTLLWLVAIILIFPYLETTPLGGLVLTLLITSFLLSALYSVSDRPVQVAVGLLLAIPTLLCSWTYVFIKTPEIWIALLITMTVFIIYILLAILQKVFIAREVTLVEIFRAVMIYMMIGAVFGIMYLLLETINPASFHFNTGPADTESLLYFSFVALSTAGFGDITPGTPVSRSLVSIELLVGVMYMAVLIGLLVNAHYNARYSATREQWKGEEKPGQIRRYHVPVFSSGGPLAIVAIAMMLNLATSLVMVAFSLPFFLDTWGTSFAVIISGFTVGAIAGVLYNILMAVTVWNITSLVFIFSSILVAALTWFFWNRGWVDIRHPWLLVSAGAVTGILNAILVLVLSALLSIPPYSGTLTIYQYFSHLAGDTGSALLLVELVVETVDKTVSLVLAAVAAVIFTGLFERDLKREKTVNSFLGRKRKP
jgi:voltage-gated potassium channel